MLLKKHNPVKSPFQYILYIIINPKVYLQAGKWAQLIQIQDTNY